MKNTRKCPKCGSTDLVEVDGFAGPYGSGNHILTGMSILSAVPVNRYICCRCGYTEEWIDTKDVEKLKKSKKAQTSW